VRNILPDYEITHILGVGGFAKVYNAVGPLGKRVAVKIPRTDDMMATMDMKVIKRFRSEIEIWERLEHVNVVRLHSGSTEPLPHIVMELMEGGNLKQLMRNHKLLVGEAVHIMEQVLKGLSFAHRMASVHRDLKPENILFTADGVAKISDWGIGKFMASVGKSQSLGIKGTLDYCAPEQYDRREYGKVDWQTDVFQIGVLFYEILTGENPFAGVDFADCMGKVLMYKPELPSTINPDIPETINKVICGAIEKKKEDRWPSGGIMLHELTQIINRKKKKKTIKVLRKNDSTVKRMKLQKTKSIVEAGNRCNKCGGSIRYISHYMRWWCETCSRYIEKDDMKFHSNNDDEVLEAEWADDFPQYPCRVCGTLLHFVHEYGMWWCNVCGKYVGDDTGAESQISGAVQGHTSHSYSADKNQCHDCGGTLWFIDQYQMWWCGICQKFI